MILQYTIAISDLYRDALTGGPVLLSNSQAEISRNPYGGALFSLSPGTTCPTSVQKTFENPLIFH